MGGLFGSGSSTTTSSSQPVLSDEQSQMLKQSSRIVDNFYNNLKGGEDAALDAGDYSKLVAPLSADQMTAMGLTRSAATNGEYGRNTNAALGMIRNGASVAGQGNRDLLAASTAYGRGLGISQQGTSQFGNASNLLRQATGAPDVSEFYNPYQNDVIKTSVNDLNEQTHRQQAALSAAHAGKKAFGSRADLATGEFLGDANRTLASTIAGLRSTGYNTALSAAQNQQRQQLQGAQQYGALGSQYGTLGSQVAGIGGQYSNLAGQYGSLGTQISNIGQNYGQQAGQRQSGLLNTAQALGQSGSLQQQQSQAAIDAPLTTAGRISSIAAGYPTGTATTQSTPTASPFSQILGAGLTAASFFADGGMAGRSDSGPDYASEIEAMLRAGGANQDRSLDPKEWRSAPTKILSNVFKQMREDDPNRDYLGSLLRERIGGIFNGQQYADGGLSGPKADLEIWSNTPTDVIANALKQLPPDDPNRDILIAVLGDRMRHASDAPDGNVTAGRPRSAESADAADRVGALGAGKSIAAEPPMMRANSYLSDEAPASAPTPAPSRGLGAPQPLPQLPTNMSQFSPAEQAAGAEFNAMKAAQPAAPTEPVAPFLGGAPKFSDIRGLGGPSPYGASGAGGGLSFSGTPRQPEATGFPKMAAALSDLMTASAPAADAGAPRGLGNGHSLRSVAVTPEAASNPAPAGGLNPATNAAAASLSPEGGDQSTATVGGGKGWLGRHLDNAMDNPLLYIGLGLMASKNPSILGAIGEGVGGGIGQYTERQIGKARLGLAMQKNQQDVAFERQKLAIQQAVAEGRMTYDQARLALAQTGQATAVAAMNKPSAYEERRRGILQSGGTQADVLRMSRGANEPQDDEDKRQKFAMDYAAKNPGSSEDEGYTIYDKIAAAGANTDDLKAAAGF